MMEPDRHLATRYTMMTQDFLSKLYTQCLPEIGPSYVKVPS